MRFDLFQLLLKSNYRIYVYILHIFCTFISIISISILKVRFNQILMYSWKQWKRSRWKHYSITYIYIYYISHGICNSFLSFRVFLRFFRLYLKLYYTPIYIFFPKTILKLFPFVPLKLPVNLTSIVSVLRLRQCSRTIIV